MHKIPGGYILISRKLLTSDIMKKPPLYLKVWLWLLMRAQYQDYKDLKRGQVLTSIPEIQEAMAYYVGYRKKMPSKRQIWSVLEWLRRPYEGNDGGNDEGNDNVTMVETTKVTHGLLIDIVNYCFYQDPSNYEGNYEGNDENATKATPKELRKERQGNNINKKEYKKDKKEEIKNNIYTSLQEVRRTSVQRVVEAWNSLGLNPIKGINSNTNRHKQLMARIKEYGEVSVLEAIKHVGKSSFLRGHNKRGWIITFDWFIKPNNFIKVLEGAYDDDKWLGAGTEVVGGAATPRRVDERKLSFDEYMKVVDEYAKERF